jgi:hypothetical protein
MVDFVDSTAFNYEQGQRARKLFAAVVLAALDDAIADDKKYGNGPEQIARWARSRDGREVLSCAGIDPNERVVKGLMEFVSKGVRTSSRCRARKANVVTRWNWIRPKPPEPAKPAKAERALAGAFCVSAVGSVSQGHARSSPCRFRPAPTCARCA